VQLPVSSYACGNIDLISFRSALLYPAKQMKLYSANLKNNFTKDKKVFWYLLKISIFDVNKLQHKFVSLVKT
jgi:hypothetical protein